MAEKIPYEALLPVALELYNKIPQPPTPRVCKEEERPAEIQKAADDFASFYNRLHDNLVNHDK